MSRVGRGWIETVRTTAQGSRAAGRKCQERVQAVPAGVVTAGTAQSVLGRYVIGSAEWCGVTEA